jgi:hypothetical protein
MPHVMPIIRMLEPTGALYTATEDDNGVHFTNLIAGDPFEVQLPLIAPSTRGLVLQFTRAVPNVFQIRPGLGESIGAGAVDKYLRMATPGASVSIIASSNNNWSIWASSGSFFYGGP